MFNLAQLSGIIAAVLLMWSSSHLVLASNRVARTGSPSLLVGEKPVAAIKVAVESINEFDKYYINEVNPFVPYSKREPEKKRMWEKRHKPTTAPEKVPEEKKPTPVPPKAVELPKLVLPTYTGGKENVPEVIGSVEMQDRYLVFVKLGEKEQQMNAGDKIGEWTLEKLENGMVTFTDPDGETLRVGAVSGSNPNSIDSSGVAVDPAAGPLDLAPMTPQEMMKMLKDPKNKQQVQQMLKDPKMKTMLMNPTVQKMLRDNGLEELLH